MTIKEKQSYSNNNIINTISLIDIIGKNEIMKKHLIFSLLFGAALVLGTTTIVQAQNAESYESLMKKGNEKYNAKDYISAKTY